MKYSVRQSFSTENDIRQDESITQSFSNKKEAKAYFEEVKDNVQQGGCITTDFLNLKEDDILETHYSNFDYTDSYGRLVIAYQHTGKGMGYSHKFLDAFWLNGSNCNLSDNPDSRFKVWHTVTNLRIEDLDGLTYEEAQELVEKEVYLRLENSINLDYLGITFAQENDIIEEYDTVEVPDPYETDIHNHSFVGVVVDIRGGIATVDDGDGDYFDIETWRLTKID